MAACGATIHRIALPHAAGGLSLRTSEKGEQRNAEDIFQFSRFGAYRQPPEGVAMLTAVLQTVLIVTAAVGLIVTVLDIRRGSA